MDDRDASQHGFYRIFIQNGLFTVRESGSDSCKSNMRRQTNTINYSKRMLLAKGITFDISLQVLEHG